MGQDITYIAKQDVALQLPRIQKLCMPHLKALNVNFDSKYQPLQKLKRQ